MCVLTTHHVGISKGMSKNCYIYTQDALQHFYKILLLRIATWGNRKLLDFFNSNVSKPIVLESFNVLSILNPLQQLSVILKYYALQATNVLQTAGALSTLNALSITKYRYSNAFQAERSWKWSVFLTLRRISTFATCSDIYTGENAVILRAMSYK